jgi:hypothetical protein
MEEMEEKKGHFEKGRWVLDSDVQKTSEKEEKNESSEEPGQNKNSEDDFEKLIADTENSVKAAVDNIINLGNNLLGTKEGRKEIESRAKSAGKNFLKSIEEAVSDAKKKF